MDPLSVAGLGLGGVSLVIQSYEAVMEIYDVYLAVENFAKEYRDIRMCLLIEKYRLELWASLVILDHKESPDKLSTRDVNLWGLFVLIFNTMIQSLQESSATMDALGNRTGLPSQENSKEHAMIQDLTLSAKEKPKWSLSGVHKKIRFVLRDRKRMDAMIKQLCYLNDSLEKMTSQLHQDSLRRSLRTQFTTREPSEMPLVEQAADLLEHRDIQMLASARIVVDEAQQLEQYSDLEPSQACLDQSPQPKSAGLQLDRTYLEWKQTPFVTERIRALATYKGDNVIVDWRSCQDDAWRKSRPEAFRRRTENLTRILNSDLRPLNLSILHCVGYVNESKNFTGYAFRLPDHVQPHQQHVTLHDLITKERRPRDLPDLGDRFQLAKALVSTIFEIGNIGWLHKNISPRNIIFWPDRNTGEPDITRPYVLGFDTARPNSPNEFSEQPLTRPDDDHYRHPEYRQPLELGDPRPRSFQPSYDLYSLGVVLLEIGIWRNLAMSQQRPSSRPTLPAYRSDPNLIKNCMERGGQGELRWHTGRRYADAVGACLDHGFDWFWRDPLPYDRTVCLQRYLRQVQNKLVDTLAVCNA